VLRGRRRVTDHTLRLTRDQLHFRFTLKLIKRICHVPLSKAQIENVPCPFFTLTSEMVDDYIYTTGVSACCCGC
jgi:hypothetical protein